MRVIVKMHRRCVADMQAWLDRSPGSDGDRRALVRVAIDAMKAELARTGSDIPTATFRDEPPRHRSGGGSHPRVGCGSK